jgi:hypothetical protein
MSGWRKRQIADKIEDDMTIVETITQWYEKNNVEITWFLIGILLIGTLDSLEKREYWSAGINFFFLIANYFLRSSGFRK